MNTRASSLLHKFEYDSGRTSNLYLNTTVELILKRTRLKAACRIAWLRKLWKEEGLSNNYQYVNHAEIDSILEDRDSPKDEAEWLDQNDQLRELFYELNQIEKTMAEESNSRWSLLCKIFSIEREDADLLQICIGLRFDPKLSRLYAYLQDHPNRNFVSEDLVRRLFGYGRKTICHSESPLRIWNLIREKEIAPNEPFQFIVDPGICDWMIGVNTLDPLLVGKAEIRRPLPPLKNWPIDETVEYTKRLIKNKYGGRVRIILSGLNGSGRHTMAAVIAAKLGMTLLAIDSDQIETASWGEAYLHAQRQAFLDCTALCWNGSSYLHRAWPKHITPFPVQFVIVEPEETLPSNSDFIDHRIELPNLGLNERRLLWKQYIPESVTWNKSDFDRLVSQHQITVGEIASITSKQFNTFAKVESSVRESKRYRLGDLAQRIVCTFQWEDLVIPEQVAETLQDFLFEAKDRTTFWELESARRLFPHGRGLMALFSGPSGTGKTMSAQVIAKELGLDLYRIDLASVVSKYVGETSKNLRRILSQASHMDVVLLFDEADALLGKRTEIKDAHDRFANTDTNYLLQALENYQGIAILSTNRRSNIDEAFIRRIRYVLEFPRPDSNQRFIMWQKLIKELTGEEILTPKKSTEKILLYDLKALANVIDLTGSQIKYAVLAAWFAASRDNEKLCMKHLLHGIDRELMKEGRVLTERERERLMAYGN